MVWLHDGWEKFVEDHSIGYGYFLLFKYEGNSSFNVHIFDLTATEVDYHNNNRNLEGINHDARNSVEENSDDDYVKVLASFTGKQDISSSRNGARDEHGIYATHGRRHEAKRDNSDTAKLSKPHRCYLPRSKCKIEDGGLEFEEGNLNTSGKSSPKNPSFGVSLKPYNLFPRFYMYVPVAFSEYLPSAPAHFELHDSDGKKWLLHIIRAKSGKNYLGTGWKKVVKEKNLKVGDTCVFELNDIKKCKLKVFTFGDT